MQTINRTKHTDRYNFEVENISAATRTEAVEQAQTALADSTDRVAKHAAVYGSFPTNDAQTTWTVLARTFTRRS